MLRIGWFLWVIFLGVYLTRPISDPDVWWHLNIGRWIVSHFSLPVTDLWTVYGEGVTFRAYSWSQEIFYALFYKKFGEVGLAYLYAFISILIASSFCYGLGVVAKNKLIGLLLGTITMMGLVSHMSLRPQSVTWAFFVLIITSAHLMRQKKSGLLYLLILSALWANTHLSVVIGIIGAVLWLGDAKQKGAIALFSMILGSFFTPYIGGEWRTFFEKIDHPTFFSSIVEFGPAVIVSYPTAFLLILLFLLGVVVFEAKVRLPISHWCFLLSFVVLGVSVVKFLPFALIATSFLIAEVFSLAKTEGRLLFGVKKLIEFIETKLIGQGLYVCIIALIAVNASRVVSKPIEPKSIPDLSMDFIINSKLKSPIANGFKDGGYVSFRLSDVNGVPSQRVSIDGRTNLIPHDLWEDYLLAIRGWQGYERFLDRFNPGVLLWRKDSALPQILISSGEWLEVFREGDEYVVLTRKGAT